jgi:hypothetical protein
MPPTLPSDPAYPNRCPGAGQDAVDFKPDTATIDDRLLGQCPVCHRWFPTVGRPAPGAAVCDHDRAPVIRAELGLEAKLPPARPAEEWVPWPPPPLPDPSTALGYDMALAAAHDWTRTAERLAGHARRVQVDTDDEDGIAVDLRDEANVAAAIGTAWATIAAAALPDAVEDLPDLDPTPDLVTRTAGSVRDRLVAAGTWCPGVDLCAGDEVDGLDRAVCPLCNEVAPTYVAVPGNVRRMGQHPPPSAPTDQALADFLTAPIPAGDVSDAYGLSSVQHEAGRVRATALELLRTLIDTGHRRRGDCGLDDADDNYELVLDRSDLHAETCDWWARGEVCTCATEAGVETLEHPNGSTPLDA